MTTNLESQLLHEDVRVGGEPDDSLMLAAHLAHDCVAALGWNNYI